MASFLVGLLSAGAGGVVLVGWAADITVFKSLLPDWVTMKPNTAVGFILVGLALMMSALPSSMLTRRLAQLCTLSTGLIGLLTIGEYVFAWDPGFDQWLFPEAFGAVGTSHPGRMAPDTAVCFVLLATALSLARSTKKTAVLFTATILSALVPIIALTGLTAYFMRTISVYGMWGLTLMAVHTAILFLLLGVTVTWTAWPKHISLWSRSGRIVISVALWTLILTGSLSWNLQREGLETLNTATATARTNISKDMSFRKWATSHGGVYVPPTEHTSPNPYLNLPNRDVVTTTGTPLTLMNPAYMLRELQNNFGDEYGTRSRITSLQPLNPINAPDAWQAKVLTNFEHGGKREFIEVQQIGDQPYLRMMRPFVVESGCLKCHAEQGYKLGDIRGGIDTSVPLTSMLASLRRTSTTMALVYGTFWWLGIFGLAFFYRREHQLAVEKQIEKAFSDAVINSLPGTFYVYEDGLRLVRWNKNLETLSGYSAAELLNKHPLDWFNDNDKASAEAQFKTGAEMGGVGFESEIVLQDKAVPFFMTYSWLDLGGTKYLIGVGLDISAQKKLEDGLRQAQKMESMGTLAGGIAHDFNNILSAILGYTDLAMVRTEANKSCRDELTEVYKAADRATALVRQILTFTRKQQAEKTPLQISLIIKEALKLLRSTIPSSIEIRQAIVSQSTVMADPTQIHQLLMNLCTNASHAMMEQGGVLGVTLKDVVLNQKMIDGGSELAPGSYVLLSVSDSGCGMNKETLARIFDPYFTTKGAGKGTGLGLAVVHGIVKGHQGRIAVYSEPGHGSTFNVYLPMIIAEAASSPTLETPPPVSKAHERIMVVDDESTIRDLVSQFLTQAGYRVDAFANGLEAWQALSQAPGDWDLLLTDQTMPAMTGDQLAAKAKEIRPDLPIILCSGYSAILEGDQTKRAAVAAALQKPLSKSVLLTEVAKALKKDHQ